MKKIIGVLVLMSVWYLALGQTNSPTGNAKYLTTEESKKYNANGETMINGKPYSQYKAEQEALKKQKQAQQSAQPVKDASVVMIKSSEIVPAPAKAEPAKKRSDDEGYEVKPASPASETVAVQPSPKGTSTNPEASRPASAAMLNHLSNDPLTEASKSGSIKPEPAKAPVRKRTAAEIEKANQQQVAPAKVQPAKTDVPSTTERPAATKTQPGQRD